MLMLGFGVGGIDVGVGSIVGASVSVTAVDSGALPPHAVIMIDKAIAKQIQLLRLLLAECLTRCIFLIP
jgi:hypothetical protein